MIIFLIKHPFNDVLSSLDFTISSLHKSPFSYRILSIIIKNHLETHYKSLIVLSTIPLFFTQLL